MSEPVLSVTGLDVSFGRRRILTDVALAVGAGELVVVVGPNGAGKTTLLRAIAGLVPWRGAVSIGGTPLPTMRAAARAARIAYLPQGHVFHWPLAVADVVALGRLPRGAGASLSAADREAVARAMAATGVADHASRPVTQLSGGERARVAVARVLATEAPLILADEPTASLDPHYQLVVVDILRAHAVAGGAVVAVLHDLTLAARSADRLVVIDGGRIVADGPPRAVLTRERMRQTFGVDAAIVEVHDTTVVVPWAISAPTPPPTPPA